ncbi:MAG TPA: chemotaxis protein CheX [bacterium]|nr:chemotaxis protein CheX [bacterium]HPN32729.1 chemotaxis protein CheX [bacterium]
MEITNDRRKISRFNMLVGTNVYYNDRIIAGIIENMSDEGLMFSSKDDKLNQGDKIEMVLINISTERIIAEILEKNIFENNQTIYNCRIARISEELKNMVIPSEISKVEDYFLRSVELAIEKVFTKFLKKFNIRFHSCVILEPEAVKLDLSSALIFYKNFKGCAILSMDDQLVEKIMEIMGLSKMKMERSKIVQETLKEFSNMIFGNTATHMSEVYNVETNISVPVILENRNFDKKKYNFLQSEFLISVDDNDYKADITFLIN